MLRFTIRDVLWLTLVVGLVVGWWVDRHGLAHENGQLQFREQSLMRHLEKEGYVVTILRDGDVTIIGVDPSRRPKLEP